MRPGALFVLLIAATVSAAPVRLQPRDVVGDWVSLRRCSESLREFTANGKYRGYCFDMLEGGRWSLSGGDKIVLTHYDDLSEETFAAKPRTETIFVVGYEPHSDRTFMYVRLSDGTTDKWMK